MNMEKLRILLITVVILFTSYVSGQDLYFSQFNASPLVLNPALTGSIDGQMRITSNYRNQWYPVLIGDSYRTAALSLEGRKFFKSESYLGWGIGGTRDISGELSYRVTQANLNLSFAKLVSKDTSSAHYIIGGAQLGIAQRSINFINARWPSQHDGDGGFDPFESAPTFSNPDFLHLDFNFGIAYKCQLGNRKSYHIGLAVSHLNRPNISIFYGLPEPLSVKVTIHGGVELPLTEKLSIAPSFMFLNQNVHRQLNLGSNLKFGFPESQLLSFIQGGLFYRLGNKIGGGIHSDAFIMMLTTQYKNFELGLSFDKTVSNLSIFSANTYELSVGIIFGGDT